MCIIYSFCQEAYSVLQNGHCHTKPLCFSFLYRCMMTLSLFLFHRLFRLLYSVLILHFSGSWLLWQRSRLPRLALDAENGLSTLHCVHISCGPALELQKLQTFQTYEWLIGEARKQGLAHLTTTSVPRKCLICGKKTWLPIFWQVLMIHEKSGFLSGIESWMVEAFPWTNLMLIIARSHQW